MNRIRLRWHGIKNITDISSVPLFFPFFPPELHRHAPKRRNVVIEKRIIDYFCFTLLTLRPASLAFALPKQLFSSNFSMKNGVWIRYDKSISSRSDKSIAITKLSQIGNRHSSCIIQEVYFPPPSPS